MLYLTIMYCKVLHSNIGMLQCIVWTSDKADEERENQMHKEG